MSKREVYKCDLCGKDMTDSGFTREQSVMLRGVNRLNVTVQFNDNSADRRRDLCESCAAAAARIAANIWDPGVMTG